MSYVSLEKFNRYPRFLLSNNPENLQKEMNKDRSITIEAEYGEIEVKGTLLTLSHHGSRSHNDPPCLAKNFFRDAETVGLSHVDADSIGGAMAVLGVKPEDDFFWRGVAFIDINGPHKLIGSEFDKPEFMDKINAYWAFSEKNKVFPDRTGKVIDVTEEVKKHFEAMHKVCNNNPDMIKTGKEWAKSNEKLNEESLVIFDNDSKVILRKSDSFVNHLYNTPDKEVGRAIVAYNTGRKSITLSFADKENVSASKIMKDLFGEKAGGHDVIAGSPRDVEYEEQDAEKVFVTVCNLLNQPSDRQENGLQP